MRLILSCFLILFYITSYSQIKNNSKLVAISEYKKNIPYFNNPNYTYYVDSTSFIYSGGRKSKLHEYEDNLDSIYDHLQDYTNSLNLKFDIEYDSMLVYSLSSNKPINNLDIKPLYLNTNKYDSLNKKIENLHCVWDTLENRYSPQNKKIFLYKIDGLLENQILTDWNKVFFDTIQILKYEYDSNLNLSKKILIIDSNNSGKLIDYNYEKYNYDIKNRLVRKEYYIYYANNNGIATLNDRLLYNYVTNDSLIKSHYYSTGLGWQLEKNIILLDNLKIKQNRFYDNKNNLNETDDFLYSTSRQFNSVSVNAYFGQAYIAFERFSNEHIKRIYYKNPLNEISLRSTLTYDINNNLTKQIDTIILANSWQIKTTNYYYEKENLLIENSFNVYPNPSSELLNITFSSDNNLKKEIVISDITGRIISMFPYIPLVGLNKLEQNVYSLSDGIYFIALYENNKKLNCEKVVIKHN